MTTNEEHPVISDSNTLESHNPPSDGIPKVRRGRPAGVKPAARQESPPQEAEATPAHAEEKRPAQKVFSFSPDEEAPASKQEDSRESTDSGDRDSRDSRSEGDRADRPERSEGGRDERPRFSNNRRPDFQPNRPQQSQSQQQQRYPQHSHQQRQGGGQGGHGQQSQRHQHPQQQQRHGQYSQQQQQGPRKPQPQMQPKPKSDRPRASGPELLGGLVVGNLPSYEVFKNKDALRALADEISGNPSPMNFNELYELPLQQLVEKIAILGIEHDKIPHRRTLLMQALNWAKEWKRPIIVKGIVENLDNNGLVVYANNNYAIKDFSTFIPESMMKEYGLLRGHEVEVQVHPPREGETCPFAVRLTKVMNDDPEEVAKRIPFEDLIPYYPTRRLLLETGPEATWDNISMRVVDILTPIGLGQRGLIVAPPRTGKTVLLQGIAHAIAVNKPDAHLIVLLIDERPEEVTDFRRQVKGEVISSTFDEPASSHVHAAELVIEKARRLVECGKDVIILLDSITRLARAYNTMMPSSGKILSGGVEANALQKPKRFFGSARNIENGGSLTILGTALVETGSRMDDVIFEEFKGTGNMELHLDRELVSKRIFPSLSMDKSGTRKEELIYHPDEMDKIYSLRRAMKGVPPVEAMEMLIQRIKKTKSNTEFLLGLNR